MGLIQKTSSFQDNIRDKAYKILRAQLEIAVLDERAGFVAIDDWSHEQTLLRSSVDSVATVRAQLGPGVPFS
jgi:hypothetical protein